MAKGVRCVDTRYHSKFAARCTCWANIFSGFRLHPTHQPVLIRQPINLFCLQSFINKFFGSKLQCNMKTCKNDMVVLFNARCRSESLPVGTHGYHGQIPHRFFPEASLMQGPRMSCTNKRVLVSMSSLMHRVVQACGSIDVWNLRKKSRIGVSIPWGMLHVPTRQIFRCRIRSARKEPFFSLSPEVQPLEPVVTSQLLTANRARFLCQ